MLRLLRFEDDAIVTVIGLWRLHNGYRGGRLQYAVGFEKLGFISIPKRVAEFRKTKARLVSGGSDKAAHLLQEQLQRHRSRYVELMKASWAAGGNDEVSSNVYLLLNIFAASIGYLTNVIKIVQHYDEYSVVMRSKVINCAGDYVAALTLCIPF